VSYLVIKELIAEESERVLKLIKWWIKINRNEIPQSRYIRGK